MRTVLTYVGRSVGADEISAFMQQKLDAHARYISTFGQDMPEVRDWRWTW